MTSKFPHFSFVSSFFHDGWWEFLGSFMPLWSRKKAALVGRAQERRRKEEEQQMACEVMSAQRCDWHWCIGNYGLRLIFDKNNTQVNVVLSSWWFCRYGGPSNVYGYITIMHFKIFFFLWMAPEKCLKYGIRCLMPHKWGVLLFLLSQTCPNKH